VRPFGIGFASVSFPGRLEITISFAMCFPEAAIGLYSGANPALRIISPND